MLTATHLSAFSSVLRSWWRWFCPSARPRRHVNTSVCQAKEGSPAEGSGRTFRTFASTSTSSPAGMPARYVVWMAMLTPGRLLMVTSAADPTVSTTVAEQPPCSVEFLAQWQYKVGFGSFVAGCSSSQNAEQCELNQQLPWLSLDVQRVTMPARLFCMDSSTSRVHRRRPGSGTLTSRTLRNTASKYPVSLASTFRNVMAASAVPIAAPAEPQGVEDWMYWLRPLQD